VYIRPFPRGHAGVWAAPSSIDCQFYVYVCKIILSPLLVQVWNLFFPQGKFAQQQGLALNLTNIGPRSAPFPPTAFSRPSAPPRPHPTPGPPVHSPPTPQIAHLPPPHALRTTQWRDAVRRAAHYTAVRCAVCHTAMRRVAHYTAVRCGPQVLPRRATGA
jgi:hypothetical protein